ncbi:MAG: universal stress protein [Opitutaceae bacterium]|nr:universal stress protein [Opitutaceae bacterium]
MYKKILVALENGRADDALVPHIAELARRLGSELLLVHVADGFVARNFEQLKLAESEEMRADRAYLDGVAQRLHARGIPVATELALGNPPQEILRTAEMRGCDLIAMTSHGHKMIGDFFLGSTIEKVRHNTMIPILVVRAGRETPATPNPAGSKSRPAT